MTAFAKKEDLSNRNYPIHLYINKQLFIMKKIYSFLFTALLSVIAFTANATNITLNVDDPSRVKIEINGTEKEDIVQGDNQIEVTGSYGYDGGSVTIRAKDGAFITKVTRQLTQTDESVSNMTSCYFYVSSSNEGETWTVTSANADDLRDGSCKIYVDDASKVRVQRSYTYTDVALTGGDWNEVRYIKASELPLTIGSTDYSTPLYQVTVNGEPVKPEGSAWRISPEDNDEVRITANFPEESVPVKFTYIDDEAKGFITSVQVDNVDVTDYNDDGFQVLLGKKIRINGDMQNYKLNQFTVNGANTNFYGYYEFTVTEATTIYVDAREYGKVNATINVDNAENITVYEGYSYSNKVIQLTNGENPIELSETNTLIQIKPNSGCFITSVSSIVNDSDDSDDSDEPTNYTADWEGAYTVTVTEGMVITVVTGKIERDLTAVVYVDDVAPYGNVLTRPDRSNIELAAGYNIVDFYSGDNPFMLSFNGASTTYAYKNGEEYDPRYSGGTSYELNLEDGDIIKVFLAGSPSTYNVTFDVTGDAENVTVISDKIKEVENWSKGFATLQDTEVSIKAADGYNLTVSVNGTAVTTDEDGVFTFNVTEDTNVTLTVTSTSGIKDLRTDRAVNTNVYNLQGVLVVKNATDVEIDRLPAGIYIINGKKTVKR